MLYSKSTGGFYSVDIHGDRIPVDAMEITDAEYSSLLIAQAGGKRIVPDGTGRPVLLSPPSPPPPTVQELLASKEAVLRSEGSLRLSALAAPYLPAERETWPKQEAQARAWSIDPTAPTAMISAMAADRGIPLADLVAKILGNVERFEKDSGAILGQQQALLDTLAAIDSAAPDAATLIAAVQWSAA